MGKMSKFTPAFKAKVAIEEEVGLTLAQFN